MNSVEHLCECCEELAQVDAYTGRPVDITCCWLAAVIHLSCPLSVSVWLLDLSVVSGQLVSPSLVQCVNTDED